MKYIKTLFLFSILHLLSSTLLFSQDENYDAVYLQINKEYTLNPDGSMDYRYVKKQKLQTYRSFNSLYGETFIVYNPDFQSLKINDVYTIMADGKKVVAPANAFNEVLPGFAANAPAYNKLKEMVVTHPGTERGAVLNLDYLLHTSKGFYPALMGNELLAEYEPVKELTLKVRVPVSVRLNFSLLNINYNADLYDEGNYKVYSWTFRDIPAIAAEDFQKSGYDLYPRLIFSTLSDRESVYSGFLKQSAFSYQLSDEIKKAVGSIVSENKEETDIILKLQEKVVNEFRLWPVPLRYTGFTCRTAAETWKSNGGTLTEKAILLVALLKEAGISAEPVAVIRKSLFDPKIGSLLDIDDMIVKVMPKSIDPLYLSVSNTNSQNLKYGLPEKTLVSLRPGGKSEILQATEYRNIITCEANLTIGDKREISGEISATVLNNCDPWLALLRDKTKAKSWFSGGISSSDLKDQKVITPGPEESFTRYSVQIEKSFHKDTNYYSYSLPYLTNGLESFGIKLLPGKRMFSFEIPYLIEENYDITYSIPDDLKLFSEGKKVDLSNKAGSFYLEIKQSGKNVRVKRNIKLNKRVIDPSEYPDFKILMDYWNSEKNRKVIFSE
jgi:hypothetical protein